MYVRYLQHQHHGTVQLLMMPLSTAADSMKSSKQHDNSDEDQSGECDPVPLPIQTFLWRQTNPFLGAKIGKLHESSCVTFERVVVQNILHGLSPSLSDAIGSISRWRFVRAAFPHIVQCCGALLGVRANEDESLPMSGSLVKILYILHWLILDAANECSEMNLTEREDIPVRRMTYSVSCIQMFVYLIAPLCHVVKEEEIEGHIRLESGLRLWQAFWQFRQPDIICFSAPVKQRKNQLPQVFKNRISTAPTALEQGIYLGDEATHTARRPSHIKVVPPPSMPSTSSPQPSKIEEEPEPVQATTSSTGIVRSVSDYKTNEAALGNQKLVLRKSKTDLFGMAGECEYKSLKEIDDVLKFTENGSFSESFQFNDKAPLVMLQEICSGASLDTSDVSFDKCRNCGNRSCTCSEEKEAQLKQLKSQDDTISTQSQETVINRNNHVAAPLLVFDDHKDSASMQSSKSESAPFQDPNEATYLDVGVLRCLLITNWSDDGAFWALKYLFNRLIEIKGYRQICENSFRSRSNSVPNVAPRGSKNELLGAEYLTWADLQERAELYQKRSSTTDKMEDTKMKVAFDVENKDLEPETLKLRVVAEQRRVSVNTLPATKKFSTRRLRSKSEPNMVQSTELTAPVSNGKMDNEPIQRKQSSCVFYPEAIGSAMFIEKTGCLQLSVVLKILVGLVERCSTLRILELALNICDTLLTIPNADILYLFEDITKIVLKTYIHLGCPNGCNEGMRTPQADFMRIKLKNLLSQMYRTGEKRLTNILRIQVADSQCQSLLDYLHAMTSFCEFDPQKRPQRPAGRRRSSVGDTRIPSYRNNFNESQSGMEGIILNTLLNPLISKLISKSSELYSPENMGLYQDVQLFVAYVNEYHGNPIRRTALSALAARLNFSEDEASNSRSNSETASTKIGSDTFLGLQKDNASLRRNLFKRKDKAEESEGDSSPSTPRNQPSMDESVSNIGSPITVHGNKKKSGGKLHFAFNLLKSVKNENSEDENWDESVNLDELSADDPSAPNADARSRISFKNASSFKTSNFRQRQSLSIDTGFVSEPHEKAGATESGSLIQTYLPPKKIINMLDVKEGVRRFSFLIETSNPGQIPDAPLLAALTELKAPVLSRAAILLECSHFVARCNRGEWPEWIKSSNNSGGRNVNLSFNASGRSAGGGPRRMFILQRAAGRNFYDWAIQISARLKKMLEKPAESSKDVDEKRRLKLYDDIEDFLDDSTVNDNSGERCPPALQLLACHLLLQITAFLRETFQLIPRSKTAQKPTGGSNAWEKVMTNRRWSILSNTFNQQTGSIHSINDLHPNFSERRVSYSTADEESSPRGSHDLGDDGIGGSGSDKKVRRLAQGRQRLLKRGSPSSGGPQSSLESSRKKRETSFRRKTKSPSAIEMEETEPVNPTTPSPTNWLQRRRKATSLRCNAGVRWHMRSMRIRGSPAPMSPPMGAQSFSELNRSSSNEASPFQSPSLSKRLNSSIRGANGKNRDSLKPSNVKSSPLEEHGDQHEVHGGEKRSSAAFSSAQLPKSLEDDEEDMMKNLPWIKVMTTMANQFDTTCKHDKHCSVWCFDRVYRQCNRLSDSLKMIYNENDSNKKLVDRRTQIIDGWTNIQAISTKKRSSNPRRESAIVRQAGMERVPLALRGLLIEKLGEIEDSKSAKKDGGVIENKAAINLSELNFKEHPVSRYINTQLLSIVHSPLSMLLKSAVIMQVDDYKSVVNISWSLLIHADLNTVATAAAMFVCCSLKCPDECMAIIKGDLSSNLPTTRTAAVRRFYALWRHRYHVWLKMEDGAHFAFKVPPPGIDFTTPSPPIGQSQVPVVDPPWMPHVKTKVEELSLKEEEHSTSQTIMTMTRTRRKQKQEMVKKTVREAEERQCELRQQFCLRATPIVQQASYEPGLFTHINVAQQQQNADADEFEATHMPTQNRQQMPLASYLFPSSILSVVPQIVEMMDDVQVDKDGCAVGDLCRRTAWSCLVEDPTMFLRHFLEKLTNKDKQEHLFALLRKLILTFRPLPSQTAHALLNQLFGLVMFYVRTPCDGCEKSMGLALSIIWLVTPYVHGLYFKDLKQTLKKEQCDQAIMITANVPSTKKIIVHGPDSSSGGIPSQFPIHEETQFQQILTDSLEFFNIPENESNQYFLVDYKTQQLHLPSSYVRDFYFFHRLVQPQLLLVRMDPDEAYMKMKTNAFQQKLIESGKVLLTHYALKHSPENVVPQRIFFLHDEFTHLPSFPRRSLESCFGFYNGKMGAELQAIDSVHKFVWSQLVSDMFEKMENAFMFGDLHLFINVINGILTIHCEDVLILRRCMATYLTMAVHFNTLFASQGFFLIMPTILRCYSQRQTNKLFKNVVEFVCKQFYILHRKPFLLQMFGSIADICDQNNDDLEVNAMQVKAKYLFNLLLAMENMEDMKDNLDILPLVPYPKPLKALDLCYRDDPNTFFLLPDAVASCVTVCAFAPESKRSHQMLLIMQAILPHYIQHLETETHKHNNSPSALKHEITSYTTMCVEMKALVNSCEALSRGPTRAFDLANNISDRGKSFIADSPQFFDPPTLAEEEPKSNAKGKSQSQAWDSNIDNSEAYKESFRGPREALLLLCAAFVEKAGPRLKELTKLSVNLEHTKMPEMFDAKCYVKISDVALSLLKVAPYDVTTMASPGLQKYFLIVLPVVDWSVETSRSALNIILRRLDKSISKIAKKASSRKRANWNAIANWLKGLYQTLVVFPYIAHLHPLKTITQICLRLIAGDQFTDESVAVANAATGGSNTILNQHVPPPLFSAIVLKMTAFLMQALGQAAFSLETICSHESIGVVSERIEAVLCNVLIPLFLSAAGAGKEAPQLQAKDIMFCLNLMHNTISPPPAKPTTQMTSGATLASTLIRGAVAAHSADASGRQGSISVTDRGHSATVSTHRIIRDSVVQAIMLALKIMVVVFQKQLTTSWMKIAKIIKDITAKRLGGSAFYNFIEFLVNLNLPISLIVTSVIQQKLSQRSSTDQEAFWLKDYLDRLLKVKEVNIDEVKGYSQILTRLQQEAIQLKDDFSTRLMDLPRSHTPTIGDIHSDSGSTQSVSTHKSGRNEPRRLSSTIGFNKLRGNKSSSIGHHTHTPTNTGHNLHDTTIMEDIEDETTQMITGKIIKSPSLPNARQSLQTRAKSVAGLGMFRSIRRKSTMEKDLEQNTSNIPFELQDIPHRRTKSFTKKNIHTSPVNPVIITPLATSKLLDHEDIPSLSEKLGAPSEKSACSSDRHRVVSFSTPKYSTNSQSSNTDSEEYYITARHHLI